MRKKTLLVLGAKSDIGIAIAREFARNRFDVQLASRNSLSLSKDCLDIQIRNGVNATFHEFDALNIDTHQTFIKSLPSMPDVVVSAIGLLGKQKDCEDDFEKAILVMKTNYIGVASILGLFANYFRERGYGTLIGISSVAGDRGRASNYIYGSSKAALSNFLSGLRNNLYSQGVHVITVKPGYVKTKMTSNLNLPKLITASTTQVSMRVFKAYKFKQDIIYIMPIWGLIMIIIKFIPEVIFKKMNL